jgi:hypothetical protein
VLEFSTSNRAAHPDTFANMRLSATVRAILPRSDQDSPTSSERGLGTEVKFRLASLPGFDSPTTAVQENGTYGGRRQGRQAWAAPTALLFEPRGARLVGSTEPSARISHKTVANGVDAPSSEL